MELKHYLINRKKATKLVLLHIGGKEEVTKKWGGHHVLASSNSDLLNHFINSCGKKSGGCCRILTPSIMAQGRFTLAYMSHDHLHGSHAGLIMIERVKI